MSGPTLTLGWVLAAPNLPAAPQDPPAPAPLATIGAVGQGCPVTPSTPWAAGLALVGTGFPLHHRGWWFGCGGLRGSHLPTAVLGAPVVPRTGRRAGHGTPRTGTWSGRLHQGDLQPREEKMSRGWGGREPRGLGVPQGAALARGVLRGTRGQQGHTAATAVGCSGSSGASPWGSAGGTPDPAWEEQPHILLGGSIPAPCCSCSLPGVSWTQGMLRASSRFLGPVTLVPGWIWQSLRGLWGRAELLPTSAHGAAGACRGRAPMLGHSISLHRCLRGDQAWHVRGVAVAARGVFRQEGVPVPRVRVATCRCF